MTNITFSNFFRIIRITVLFIGTIFLLLVFFYKYGLVDSLISRTKLKNEAKILNSFGLGSYDGHCEYHGYVPIVGKFSFYISSYGDPVAYLICQNDFTLTSADFDKNYRNKIENLLIKNGWTEISPPYRDPLPSFKDFGFKKDNYRFSLRLDDYRYTGEDSEYPLEIFIRDDKYSKY